MTHCPNCGAETGLFVDMDVCMDKDCEAYMMYITALDFCGTDEIAMLMVPARKVAADDHVVDVIRTMCWMEQLREHLIEANELGDEHAYRHLKALGVAGAWMARKVKDHCAQLEMDWDVRSIELAGEGVDVVDRIQIIEAEKAALEE